MATSSSEKERAGPAPGRPSIAVWRTRKSSTGVLSTEAALEVCPAIAVPITVKMPDPMTAPMPNAVSDSGPRVFFRRVSGFSESRTSLSMDFVAKICFGRAWLLRVHFA